MEKKNLIIKKFVGKHMIKNHWLCSNPNKPNDGFGTGNMILSIEEPIFINKKKNCSYRKMCYL